MINKEDLNVTDAKTTYYVPHKLIKLEKGGGSPFGKLTNGYVVVTYDGRNFDYYWTSSDTSKSGFFLTYEKNIEGKKVVNPVEVDTSISIGNRNKIIVFNDDGSIKEEKVPVTFINDKEDYNPSNNSNNDDKIVVSNLFIFDKETSTIIGLNHYRVTDMNKCINTYSTSAGISKKLAEEKCKFNNNQVYASLGDALASTFLVENNLNNLVIPSTIDGVAVKKIKDLNSYKKTNNLIVYTIDLPSTIESIDSYAFSRNFFLYNIVNRTSTSFNWGNILYGSDTGNTFNIGKYSSNRDARILNITKEVVSYDLKNIFSIKYENGLEYLILINNKGYNVLFNNTLMTLNREYDFCLGSLKITDSTNNVFFENNNICST